MNSVDKVSSTHYTCNVCVCDSVLCCIVQQSCPPVYNYLHVLVHFDCGYLVVIFHRYMTNNKVNS